MTAAGGRAAAPNLDGGGGGPRTMLDKIWEAHEVARRPPAGGDDAGGPSLLYVDRHLVHEVTSPQAFAGLRAAGRRVRRPDLTLATADHNVPTTTPPPAGTGRPLPMADATSAAQLDALSHNCAEFGVDLFGMGHPDQGIVHVIGPELGFTLPGATIVCGDSHTSTHGAFGALAFGIGTSEVEHVLASQTVWMHRPESMLVRMDGSLPGTGAVTAKDAILSVIRGMGTAGATGAVIEYAGPAVSAMTMEERMTVCNMSIEAGARAGMVAPDGATFEFLRGRRYAPAGALFDEAVEAWRSLPSDPSASHDREFEIDASSIAPQVSWGTSPGMTCDVTEAVPDPAEYAAGDAGQEDGARAALEYMGLEAGTPITDVPVDRVFIGSCTNARLGDLAEAARVARGRRVADGVRAMVVPGSRSVKRAAEEAGLDAVFRGAGFEWREPGCSMCLGMNPDVLDPGERCASTSNRNFEGRQGAGGRTHLVSPVMAAAAAVAGRFVDVREWV